MQIRKVTSAVLLANMCFGFQASASVTNSNQVLPVSSEATFCSQSPDTVEKSVLSFELASAYLSDGEFNKARKEAENAIDLSVSCFGRLSKETVLTSAKLYGDLYDFAVKQGDKHTAISYQKSLKGVIDNLSEITVDSSDTLATVYSEIALQLESYRLPVLSAKQSIAFAETSAQLAYKAWGNDDTRTIKQFFELGRLQYTSGQYDVAAQTLTGVIASLERIFDYSHPWALQSHVMIAEALANDGQLVEAIQHSQQVAQMKPWQDNIEPILLLKKTPDKPRAAMKFFEDAHVTISFDINTNGQVQNARIIDQFGGKRFSAKALEALNEWRFSPRIVDGEPVIANNQTVTFDFNDAFFEEAEPSRLKASRSQEHFYESKRSTLIQRENRTMGNSVY